MFLFRGSAPEPCLKEDRGFLLELMEGVEDIPIPALEVPQRL